MKKITYLVAPLMVMPFLLGCNKVTTHKVDGVVVNGNSLTFTTMNGKELNDSAFNEGQDFKFKVKANNNTEAPSQYTVIEDGIGIYVGESGYPLFDGYKFEYTDDTKTEAVITISAEKTKSDIHLRGIAAKEGNYIYDVLLTTGVTLGEGKERVGWQAKGDDFTITFAGDGTYSAPGDEDIMLGLDGIDNFQTAKDLEATVSNGKLTLSSDKAPEKYLLITAKAKDIEFTEYYSWDEIKEISDAGFAPFIFNIGDEKKIKIEENNEYTARIIGFNHDELATPTEGRTHAGITFQFTSVYCGTNKKVMNTVWNEHETSSSFPDSSLNLAAADLAAALPEDLAKNLAEVKKYVGVYDGSWKLGNYNTKVFPLAHSEMSTTKSSYEVPNEGTIYTYYVTHTGGGNRIFRDLQGSQVAAGYWLRTPRINMSARAWTVNERGSYVYSSDNAQYVYEADHGFVPAFCI